MMKMKKPVHWYQPRMPERHFCIPAALIIFFTLLFLPQLCGRIFNHPDALEIVYPYAALMQERLWSLDIFWNELNGFGFPYFVTLGYTLQPLLYFFLIFAKPVIAVHLSIVTYMTLAAWMFTIFLQKEGYSLAASITGGTLFAWITRSWIFDPAIVYTLPLLAGTLLLLQDSDHHPLRSFCGLSFIIAIGWLGLHVQFAFLFLATISMFVTGRTIDRWIMKQRHPWQLSILWCGAAVTGTLVGLFRLLPLYAYGQLSFRSEAKLSIPWGGWLGLKNILGYVIPDTAYARFSGEDFLSPYLGAFFFICVILALAKRWREKRIWGYLAGFLCTLAFAAPITAKLLFSSLPFISTIGPPTRWISLQNIWLIPVFCVGFQDIITHRYPRLQQLLSLVCIATGISMLLTKYALAVALWDSSLGDTKLLRYALSLLITGTVLHEPFLRSLARQVRPLFMSTACIVSFVIFAGPWMMIVSTPHISTEMRPTFLKEVTNEGGSLLSFRAGQSKALLGDMLPSKKNTEDMVNARILLLLPNQNIFWGIPSVGFYEPLMSRRIERMNLLIGAEPLSRIGMQKSTITPARMHELLNLLGIEWLLTTWPVEGIHLEKVGQKALPAGSPLSLYHNSDAQPRISFAEKVTFLEPDENAVFHALEDPMGNQHGTIIECEGCTGMKIFSAKGSMSTVQHTPRLIRVQVTVTEEQWLIIRVASLPGWTVQVDGTSVASGIAHGLFVTFPVSPGTHDVLLTFSLQTLLKHSWQILRGEELPWLAAE